MYKTSWCDSPHIYIRQLGSIRRKHIGCILEKSLADLQMPSHLWLKKKKKADQAIYVSSKMCTFSFVDYVPIKGEIIWYLSLTPLLISP